MIVANYLGLLHGYFRYIRYVRNTLYNCMPGQTYTLNIYAWIPNIDEKPMFIQTIAKNDWMNECMKFIKFTEADRIVSYMKQIKNKKH